jgi:Restriction endonuclease NotI.
VPFDPYEIICEILGQPAIQMQNPVNEDNLCPFRNSTCTKRSHRIDGPFPVCSVYRKKRTDIINMPIAVCPRRLYAADIYNDVISHCWPGKQPQNPIVVHEVKMGDVGNVDMVIADLSDDGKQIENFISIELQTIDITGSYEPAYSAIVLNYDLETRPTYNFNYKNVQKRFITQLIDKGFYHHHWGTKIIAVLQDVVYDHLKASIDFAEVNIEKSNVVFMQYKMELTDSPEGQRYELKLKAVTGTTHNELMMSSLYHQAPPKAEFCDRIIRIYNAGVK